MCCLTLALSSLSPLPVLLASRTQGLFQGEPMGYGASAATRGMARCSTITSVGRRCYGFAAITMVRSDAIWKHTHGLQSVRRGAAGGITLARGGGGSWRYHIHDDVADKHAAAAAAAAAVACDDADNMMMPSTLTIAMLMTIMTQLLPRLVFLLLLRLPLLVMLLMV